jgi:CO/xanthine dehydrogenase FAD-binding subunit
MVFEEALGEDADASCMGLQLAGSLQSESEHHQRSEAASLPRRDRQVEPRLRLARRRHLAVLHAADRDRHPLDLRSLRWPALAASNTGLDIAATCTIAELYGFQPPAEWTAAPLFQLCARAFLASFKIWNAATVGGNICMSLPAGPMVTLATALEARYTLLPRDGASREVAAIDFVTGNHTNVLAPGELLRNIHLPARALRKRFASHRSSLTHLGRSAVFLIGTRSPDEDDLLLTITAATPRPAQISFDHTPSAAELRHAIDEAVPAEGYFDDVHGSPAYRRRLTYYYAEQIRAELANPGAAA